MLYDIWTVFWRDWVVLKHRMIKFILSRMVAPILYMVAFGWGLGRSINTGTGSYLDFLVPGILALNLFFAHSVANTDPLIYLLIV